MTAAPLTDDEIAQLRALLARGTGDSIAPNYLSQDASGIVAANFTGHLSAQGGIDLSHLPATSDANTVPDDAKIDWSADTQFGPELIARVAGWNYNGPGLEAVAVTPSGNRVGMLANAPEAARTGLGLYAESDLASGDIAEIRVNAGADTLLYQTWQASGDKLLLDSQGRSSWAKVEDSPHGMSFNLAGPYLLPFNVANTFYGSGGTINVPPAGVVMRTGLGNWYMAGAVFDNAAGGGNGTAIRWGYGVSDVNGNVPIYIDARSSPGAAHGTVVALVIHTPLG